MNLYGVRCNRHYPGGRVESLYLVAEANDSEEAWTVACEVLGGREDSRLWVIGTQRLTDAQAKDVRRSGAVVHSLNRETHR